jgi:hypothetical protein
MALESSRNIDTVPFIRLENPGAVKQDAIIAQDAGRTEALAQFTVMAQNPVSGKFIPLTDVDIPATAASLVCGTLGGDEEDFDDITAGSFKITVNGTEIPMTGLNFSAVTSIFDVAEVIDAAAAGRFRCRCNGTAMVFTTMNAGSETTISVLSAAGSGTDISGSGFLNGLTGTGVVTAGTGPDGEDIPSAIYVGDDIDASDIAAGDISDAAMLVGAAFVDKNQLVLENSLALTSEVKSMHMSVESILQMRGLFMEDTVDISSYENA